MTARSLYLFAGLVLSIGCGRQSAQMPAAASTTTSATQALPAQSGDPESVERTAPPARTSIMQAPLATQAGPYSPMTPDTQRQDPNSQPAPNQTGADSRGGLEVTIPAQTRIRVRLADTLDTRRSRPGEIFMAHLDEPIVSGDVVVVPKGTTFQGHVTESKHSGRLKGRAYLGVTLDSFQLNGTSYTLTTASDVRASTRHRKRNIAIIGGGAGTGAAIGAVAGGGVGALIGAGAGAAAGTTTAIITGRKNVSLPAESKMVFSLRSSLVVRG